MELKEFINLKIKQMNEILLDDKITNKQYYYGARDGYKFILEQLEK